MAIYDTQQNLSIYCISYLCNDKGLRILNVGRKGNSLIPQNVGSQWMDGSTKCQTLHRRPLPIDSQQLFLLIMTPIIPQSMVCNVKGVTVEVLGGGGVLCLSESVYINEVYTIPDRINFLQI